MNHLTQRQMVLELFRIHDRQVTLATFLQHGLCSPAKQIAELRQEGYVIDCEQDQEEPFENLYTLVSEPVRDEQEAYGVAV